MSEEIDMKPPRFVRPLTAKQRCQVEELFHRGPNARVRRRTQAVRLSAMGYSVSQIVEILGCSRQTVHNWLNAFEARGCEGLFDKPRSGRPVTATVDYRSRLVQAVRTNPRDFSYPFTVWTVTRLRAHMAKEMNILLSESRVRQIMKQEGLAFKRPKHTLAKKRDEDAFAGVRDLLDQAKKSPWNPVPA
jgi:putative transposase